MLMYHLECRFECLFLSFDQFSEIVALTKHLVLIGTKQCKVLDTFKNQIEFYLISLKEERRFYLLWLFLLNGVRLKTTLVSQCLHKFSLSRSQINAISCVCLFWRINDFVITNGVLLRIAKNVDSTTDDLNLCAIVVL